MQLPEEYISFLETTFHINLREPKAKDLKAIAQTVHRISEALTRKKFREEFIKSTYMNDDVFRQAYLLYFTTCNLLKIFYPLSEIALSSFFEKKKDMKVLDLGSGTGTMIFGFSLWHDSWRQTSARQGGLESLNFTACDQSQNALQELKQNFEKLCSAHKIETHSADIETITPLPQKFDLITGANFLNEVSETANSKVLEILRQNLKDDGFAILIEPALIETSRALLAFRDRALTTGLHVYSPCFTQKNCHALIHAGDWCHHAMEWERPKFIEVIDKMVGNIKKSLKFSYIVLTKQDVHLGDFLFKERNFETQFRVVSELFNEKGRKRIFLCNDLGRNSFIKNNRDDLKTNESFDELKRYDVVEIKKFEVRKNDVQIQKESIVQRSI